MASLPRFRRLPHTADCRIAIWGEDERALFANAVAGFCAVATGGRRGRTTSVPEWLAVEAWPATTPARLVRIVNESIYVLFTRQRLPVAVRLADDRAWLGVVPFADAPGVVTEVKAATFHDLAVRRERSRLRAVLTLDL